jgi:hypothetical protein
LKKNVVTPERLVMEALDEVRADLAALRRSIHNGRLTAERDTLSSVINLIDSLPNDDFQLAFQRPRSFIRKYSEALPAAITEKLLMSILEANPEYIRKHTSLTLDPDAQIPRAVKPVRSI